MDIDMEQALAGVTALVDRLEAVAKDRKKFVRELDGPARASALIDALETQRRRLFKFVIAP